MGPLLVVPFPAPHFCLFSPASIRECVYSVLCYNQCISFVAIENIFDYPRDFFCKSEPLEVQCTNNVDTSGLRVNSEAITCGYTPASEMAWSLRSDSEPAPSAENPCLSGIRCSLEGASSI